MATTTRRHLQTTKTILRGIAPMERQDRKYPGIWSGNDMAPVGVEVRQASLDMLDEIRDANQAMREAATWLRQVAATLRAGGHLDLTQGDARWMAAECTKHANALRKSPRQ